MRTMAFWLFMIMFMRRMESKAEHSVIKIIKKGVYFKNIYHNKKIRGIFFSMHNSF